MGETWPAYWRNLQVIYRWWGLIVALRRPSRQKPLPALHHTAAYAPATYHNTQPTLPTLILARTLPAVRAFKADLTLRGSTLRPNMPIWGGIQ